MPHLFDYSLGYPPADHEVRDFLAADKDQADVYDRACAFLEALFEHTATVLQDDSGFLDEDELASQFRTKMTAGQTFRTTNAFRTNFYREVIQNAHKILAAQVCMS